MAEESPEQLKRIAALKLQLAEAEAELNAVRQKHQKTLEDAKANTLEYNKAEQALLQSHKAIAEAQLNLAKAHQDTDGIKAAQAAIEDLTTSYDALVTAQETAENQYKSGAESFDHLASSFLKLDSGLGKLAGAFGQGTNGLRGFKDEALKSIVTGKLFTSMALKWTEASVQFALEQDKVISNFRRQTGAGTEFNDVIRQTERATFSAGVTLADAADAVRSLKNEYTDFTYLSKDQQKELTTTSALLNRLGMSFSSQSQIMQAATQNFGLSVEQSTAFMRDLAGAAQQLGMDTEALAGQFKANIEFLSGFGSRGTEVFKELAVQAKSLGMEMSQLTGLVDKFTTFDQAGKSVGRLNAILGGPFLNSIDMLNAAMEDPTEAIQMIRDSVDQAGMSFEDLGRAEKMAFASALGMSMEELTNLMGQSQEEIELTALKQKELEKQSAATQAITEKLKNAMKAFYISLGPTVEALAPLFDGLVVVSQAMGNFLNTANGIPIAMGLLGALFGMGIGGSFALSKALLAVTAAIPVVGVGLAAAQEVVSKKYIKQAIGYMAGGALLGGAAGFGIGKLLPTGGAGSKSEAKPTARFADGGVTTGSTVAMVGERGPELVELPGGSRVTTAPATQQLTDAITSLASKLDGNATGPIHLAVYIGQDKVDDFVVKSLKSPAVAKVLSPYAARTA